MKLVINTNILFSFFNKKSTAREYATLPSFELYAPYFALEEINDHRSEIMEKFSLSKTQFSLIIKLLQTVINFIPMNDYEAFLPTAGKISPDPNDVDFFALSLKLQCMLWSNDALLKKQSHIKVISTKDVVERFYK